MKASDIVSLPMQLGSAVRHRRVFHPLGVLASGRIERVAPSGIGLPVESTEVIGRVSKGVGVPGELPDLIGLAWRLPPQGPGAKPWDILTVSTGSGALTRFALRPTLSWSAPALTTLMPLRHNDRWWWLRAKMTTPMGGGLGLDVLRDAIDGAGVQFDVGQANGLDAFEPLARLTLDVVIPTDTEHDVSFDPVRNTGPGLPLGPEWLANLRGRAYQRSRAGRVAPDAPLR